MRKFNLKIDDQFIVFLLYSDSIGKVQQNTEFYWRYQRYSFVREYFECLPLGYPPLIIIPHIILFILFLHRKFCPRLFQNHVNDENHVDNENHVSKLKRNTPIFSKFDQ